MASGPFHYRQAEQLLDAQAALEDDDARVPNMLAQANVHATLAAAAAFALPHVVRLRVGADEWVDTLGVDLSQATGL